VNQRNKSPNLNGRTLSSYEPEIPYQTNYPLPVRRGGGSTTTWLVMILIFFIGWITWIFTSPSNPNRATDVPIKENNITVGYFKPSTHQIVINTEMPKNSKPEELWIQAATMQRTFNSAIKSWAKHKTKVNPEIKDMR